MSVPVADGFQPYVMKDVDLILGDIATGDNFKCQIRSIVLTPSMDIQRTKTACPTGQFSATDEPEWSLDLGYLYGRHATDQMKALGRYLIENVGEQVPFTVRWDADDPTDGYTGTVTIVPGPVGGNYGQFSEQSVSLPVEGQPVPLGTEPGE